VILFSRPIWTSLTPAQQQQALQAASDLIKATAVLVPGASKSQLTQLVDSLKTIGVELKIFTDPNNGVVPDGDTFNAASHLANLFPGANQANISSYADSAVTALGKLVH